MRHGGGGSGSGDRTEQKTSPSTGLSAGRSPESTAGDEVPLCIELTLEKGKLERLMVCDFESLDAIVKYLSQKYGTKRKRSEI